MEVNNMSGCLLAAAGGSAMGSYAIMIVIIVAMYAFMFLPQRRQQKRDAQMRASLDVGNEVLTQGGIIGRIVSLRDDSVVIETGSDRVKLRILRNAIIQNTTPKDPEK
jgi:preprotein translocase subunit YajC